MTKAIGIILLFLILTTSISIAQNIEADVLNMSQNEITEKYLDIAYEYLNKSEPFFEKSLNFAQKAFDIAMKNKDYKNATRSLYIIGQAYQYLGNYKDEIISYEKGLKLAKQINDNENIFLFNSLIANYKAKNERYQESIEYYLNCLDVIGKNNNIQQLAWLYNQLGVAYFHLSKYEKALEYYFKALALKENTKDNKGIARTYLNIGTVYSEINNYKNALTYLQKSLTIAEKNNLFSLQAIILNNIGNIEQAMEEYQKSIKHFKKALKLKNKLEDLNGIASTNNNIGTAYEELGEYLTAKKYYRNALAISLRINDLNGIAVSFRNLGNISIKLGNIETAIVYLNNAITMADTNDLPAVRKNAYYSYAILYSNLGNHKKSDKYYNRHIRLRDSLNNAEYRNRMAQLEILYETEKKERENKLLRLENEAKTNAIQQQQTLITFLVVVAGLIFLLVVLVLKNNKERRRYSQQLEDKNKKLTESEHKLKINNATKDRFFSIISHDLRNPFAALSMVVDNLKYNLDIMNKNKLAKVVTSLEDTVNGTNDLLLNLLEWSRTQTNRMQYLPKKIDVAELFNKNIPLLQSNAETKQIRIHKSFERNCTVFADEDMLNTIIRNLVSNAIKFTPRNGNISIVISRKNGSIETNVIDTGVGIAPENIEKIFRIDAKIKSKGTDNEEGTGLGLILCKEFIDKHNGSIEVKSELNKGSIFTFRLPVVE